MKFKGNSKSDPGSVYPEGDYFLVCTHVQHQDKGGAPLISKRGNPMWVLELTVAEGPFANRKLWHYLVWIPEGTPGHGMALKTLKAFGIDPEGDIDVQPEQLLNVTVKARVGIQEQDDFPPKNVVAKWYTPPELEKPARGIAQEEPPAEEEEPAPLAPKPPAKPAGKPRWGGK